MSIKIFGIKNCDTVKKALKWLSEEGIEHTFHDFRTDGLDTALAQSFVDALGMDAVVNQRGTTWRKLSDDEKAAVTPETVAAFLADHDAVIKRPVWRKSDEFRVGFAAKQVEEIQSWLLS